MKEVKEYMTEDFLLDNEISKFLFHTVAKSLPIIDFHNHIDPKVLVGDTMFDNIAQLWITGDPYKHRAMRINGIDESRITGSASDKDKFLAWAETLPKTIGNPLFHWSSLEMKRVFGIDTMLTRDSAEDIWNQCNEALQKNEYSANGIMSRWNIEAICTSDDWFDDVSIHKKATENAEFNVFPSLRADKATEIELWNSNSFLDKLSNCTNQSIKNLEELKLALTKRLQHFSDKGCKLSDHALNNDFSFKSCSLARAENLFYKILEGFELKAKDRRYFKSFLLTFLAGEYQRFGWTMQLHVGAQRKTSSRLRELAGSAGGYAAMGNGANIKSLCLLLDNLEKNSALPETILYNLNPIDNAAFATLTGSFAEDGIVGKIQFGPAWWYNDHFTGIRDQLLAVSNYGLLSRFIGMTTDSRSILSFSRHEYFRRILCNLIGEWVMKGHIPFDEELLKQLIIDITYTNSKNKILNGK